MVMPILRLLYATSKSRIFCCQSGSSTTPRQAFFTRSNLRIDSMNPWNFTCTNCWRESSFLKSFPRLGPSKSPGSEFMGKTFQAAQLTHERFLTVDHSFKIILWYLPNWTSTNLWWIVLYIISSTTYQRSVEVQFDRYQKKNCRSYQWSKLSCVSCAAWNVFPINLLTSSVTKANNGYSWKLSPIPNAPMYMSIFNVFVYSLGAFISNIKSCATTRRFAQKSLEYFS